MALFRSSVAAAGLKKLTIVNPDANSRARAVDVLRRGIRVLVALDALKLHEEVGIERRKTWILPEADETGTPRGPCSQDEDSHAGASYLLRVERWRMVPSLRWTTTSAPWFPAILRAVSVACCCVL